MKTTTLTCESFGLKPTGNDDPTSPRSEYKLDFVGNINVNTFLHRVDNNIWLTPGTLTDLMLFTAFSVHNYQFATIDENLEIVAFNDYEHAQALYRQGKNVLINPVNLKTH